MKEFTEITAAYERLGDAIYKESSLNERERSLVKLALAAGTGSQSEAHSQVRKGLIFGL
ncbi:MAG: carboxymuconolactone decarboxylase family protein [Bacteroidota bacterium]